nr:hypothetical protein [Tanacetum cinerariifolium]
FSVFLPQSEKLTSNDFTLSSKRNTNVKVVVVVMMDGVIVDLGEAGRVVFQARSGKGGLLGWENHSGCLDV